MNKLDLLNGFSIPETTGDEKQKGEPSWTKCYDSVLPTKSNYIKKMKKQIKNLKKQTEELTKEYKELQRKFEHLENACLGENQEFYSCGFAHIIDEEEEVLF